MKRHFGNEISRIRLNLCTEIKSFYPGPYYCYYNLPTHDLVQQAQSYIEEVIEDEGPFDGVIGFSQGAALAASIMLEHSKTRPLEDTFKLSIFAGASLPFDIDSNTSVTKWQTLKREDLDLPDSSSDDDEIDPYTSWRIPKNTWDPIGPLLGRYHPDRTPKAHIRQPTLHLIGSRDEYAGQAQTLSKMCGGQPNVISHPEGHRIPRDKAFQDKAARAMERLISKVNLAH